MDQQPGHATVSGNDVDVEMADAPGVGPLFNDAEAKWYARYGWVPCKMLKFPGRVSRNSDRLGGILPSSDTEEAVLAED